MARSASLIACLVIAASAQAQRPMTFGITQPNGASAARKARSLLEPYLSNALGEKVKVTVFEDSDALTHALSGGEVDIAWTTPIGFVKARQANDEVRAIAKAQRSGQGFYRAALIVKSDSPAHSLEDLKGKKVAWVSRSSASGYVFAHALIMASGQDSTRFFAGETFEGDHPGVCRAVREGRADVGATFADPVSGGDELRADGCADAPPVEDFRVVAASGPIPNDVIAIRPGFDSVMVEPIVASLHRMSRSEPGKALLNDVFRVDGWADVADDDFRAVKLAMEITADLATRPAKPADAKSGKPSKKQ